MSTQEQEAAMYDQPNNDDYWATHDKYKGLDHCFVCTYWHHCDDPCDTYWRIADEDGTVGYRRRISTDELIWKTDKQIYSFASYADRQW
jgi:hypothetical protein